MAYMWKAPTGSLSAKLARHSRREAGSQRGGGDGMSSYTKTFALCDNVDIRVHCQFVELNTQCGIEYDEEHEEVELLIGNQVVKLEGEILEGIWEEICSMVCNIDTPDGMDDDEDETKEDIVFELESAEGDE
jgi:hypothetical protein